MKNSHLLFEFFVDRKADLLRLESNSQTPGFLLDKNSVHEFPELLFTDEFEEKLGVLFERHLTPVDTRHNTGRKLLHPRARGLLVLGSAPGGFLLRWQLTAWQQHEGAEGREQDSRGEGKQPSVRSAQTYGPCLDTRRPLKTLTTNRREGTSHFALHPSSRLLLGTGQRPRKTFWGTPGTPPTKKDQQRARIKSCGEYSSAENTMALGRPRRGALIVRSRLILTRLIRLRSRQLVPLGPLLDPERRRTAPAKPGRRAGDAEAGQSAYTLRDGP